MKKYILLILIFVIFLLSGCDNIIGLGDKVDLDPPVVSIGTYEDGTAIASGDYVRGTITLRGSASDDTGIDSVSVSVNGSSNINATVSGSSWSCSIDTTAYEDGEKEIIILVTDIAPTPRTDETRLLLYFDNTPPVVMVKNPTGFRTTSYTDADLSIKGEASDPFRVREIRVNLVGGSGTIGDVSGTNTWSCIFESTGTGSYIFEIEAEDYAGNVSSHFYHYDDILSANNNDYITPEEVYLVENGQDTAELTGSELIAAELTDMTLSISLDLDNPVITISNPDPDALVFENVMAGNAKFIGSVSDDDGVDTDSLEISLDGGSWVSVGTINGADNSQFLTWEHSVVYGESADHTLQIRVDDMYGVSSESQIVNYRINIEAALVDITSPVMSEYIDSSDFTISGLADDTGGGVTDIDISLDNGSTWEAVTPAATLPQETVTWTYDAVSVDDGIMAIKVRASDDNGGTWTYTNTQITVDTSAPMCDYTSPRDGTYVNGEVTLYGTCSDNNLLDSVQIKIGDSGARPWIDIASDSLYNWSESFNSSEYENSTDGTETPASSGNYLVNLYIRATDKAGNVTETSAGDNILYINNALDKPIVSIIAPQEDVSLGGSAIVSGTSSDDDGEVYGVYMQIDVTTASGDTPNFSDTLTFDHGIDFDGSEGNPPVTSLDESTAYLVEGKAPWSVTLNENGELYNTDSYHDGVPDGHEGDIYIKVWAKDKDGGGDSVTGDVKTLHFRFDNSIPQITNLGPPSESYVSGTFNIEAEVTDESTIKHLEISYDGGTTYHYLIQDGVDLMGYGSWTTTNDDPVDNPEYAAVIPIDTSNIPDVGNVTSDDISIRLKVTDDTNYQSQETLIYYVDNNLPSGWMSQDTSDIYGTGDTALLYGYADDTGAVSGVEKVILYFEKGGLFYSPFDGSSTAVTQEDINGVPTVFPSDTSYHMVIDNTAETLSGDNSDGDGLAEELNVGTNYEWKCQFDTNNIPDGVSIMHFLIYDQAGNRFHSSKSVFIKNDKPEIVSMDVGFDLDKNGSVQGDEIFPYTGQFKARSRLFFNFNAADGGGITSYQVYEGTNVSGLNVLSSATGTIDISGKLDGSYYYFCQVTDGDGITDDMLIYVEIDNVDNDPPEITLDPLTKSSVIDGHIDVDNDSLYDGADADVSGTIALTGRITDDQGIEEIRLTLDGSMEIVASWVGGFFISQDGNFTIDSQTIDPGTGHDITWTYNWNTATITSVAADDVSAVFEVDDFAPIPNQDTQGYTVDVVPYISNIETSITSSFSNAFSRSALGKYPVMVNNNDTDYETVTVNGYNLNPVTTGDADSDVRLSLYENGLNGTVKSGDGLTYSNVAADYTSVDVNMQVDGGGPVAGSGYLSVFTNGIPTVNNINNDATNSEADYVNPLLGDDRYLSIWDLRLLRTDFSLANNAVYPSMSMNGDTPEFAYENNSQGWGIALHHDGTNERYVYENWDLFTYTAIDHNSDGDNSLLFDINVVNGNNGDYNAGNYGGILTKFFGNVPATSWNGWSYRFQDYQVWLENLLDEDGGTTAVLNRYNYPDIMTVGTSAQTRVFYSVYDSLKDRILFRYFTVGEDNSIDNSSGGEITDSGYSVYTDLEQHESGGSFPEYDGNDLRFDNNAQAGMTPTGQQIIESVNTGPFTAVAGTSDGNTAVIAYYDASGTGNIRLKYNTTPTNSGTWETIGGEELIDSGNGGEYLDMKIDSNDNIHIGYYDNNNGDLRYIYIPVNDFASDDFGTVQKAVVDSYFDVGEKVTLELNTSDVPYLSYKGVNRSGKVAWLSGALGDGADSGDQYTGDWEIMILPTQINNTDSNRFCIGLNTTDYPVVGYTNGGLEYITMLPPLTD